ncbi:Arylacetamide deacetylase [Holothuria leucospilota]|uniref:Arylacetamide deacetylase n=1 Tax=Holothuria leucospilota TaxID=206669 RepID=A0A9Q1H2Q0_HOLLE|nr:Arylacetamide deacetylase [Holothuria leucospilota]
MKYFGFIFLVTGLGIAYLLYTPVPDGLTQPMKFRIISAGANVFNLVVSIQNIIWPNEPNDILTMRYLSELGESRRKIQAEVPGSKFRARETTFDGVTVRLYEPISKPTNLLPGFIFYHGGGFCIGSTKMYDGLTRQFADELDAVVVSVEYRLSPEYSFPVPFEDSLKAAKWFISHAQDYGVDPKRIAIGGDSAGGSLSSLVTHHIHDDKSIPDPKVQLLVYPSLQKIDTKTPSYQKYWYYVGNYGVLPPKRSSAFLTYYVFGQANEEFQISYRDNNHTSSEFKKSSAFARLDHSLIPANLRDPVFYSGPTDKSHGNAQMWEQIKDTFTDPRFNSFVREDLSGLPVTLIQTCGFDVLRDDGIFYWLALKAAGVRASWVDYESGFHGVYWMGGGSEFELGKKMRKDSIEFLRKEL